MKDRISELILSRPELQFSHETAKSKVNSLFGNTDFAIGMGMGHRLGNRPSFMNKKSKHNMGNFMQARMGV
jgi:hypothetical protein